MGTKVGDPQELKGIVQALCATHQEPLLIGSTKSNMGHPEPASGLAALAKVLSLEHRLWVPNLHFHNPNPEIPALLDRWLQVVQQPLPVCGGDVGINSFSFGGSNHLPHMPLCPICCGPADTAPEAVQELLEQGLQHSQDLTFLSMLNDIAAAPTTATPFRGYAMLCGKSGGPEVQQAVKLLGLKTSQLLLSTDESTFDNIVHAFVSLTAIQIGLIDC
ncbi:hypothetical protein P7K49_000815 [Saguinus oedipus]|uniref:Beta-ketoacyl synthase C-terminal domain-containing protein n=1 Tax=Saguinus oedipus TaxID=9490 RepID=A0ABQ9WCP9_SAGOE|nr:hypothetical protein P7K49_000815 [Saguinus oedipus]